MIKFKNVTKKYSSITALNNINLDIKKGEFVFIVGESGSGKSTLSKLMTREEVATSGNVMVENVDLSTLKNRQIPYYRRKIGIVFQDFRLLNDRTVYDNIVFAMRITGESSRNIKRRIPSILTSVSLLNKINSVTGKLSGGEQQRVAIARAIANNPHLIIADEPTGNLDPENSREIFRILEEINRKGVTVIVVTHDKSIVNWMKKRVIRIQLGKIISDTQEGSYE